MTEAGIIGKLRVILSEPIDSEYKTVYVLAETRKLLETYPPDPTPFALKLYCHWALHLNLADPKHTLPFLTRVDEYVGSVLAGSMEITKEHQMLCELVFLETFAKQFKEFLDAYQLPTSVCDSEVNWHQFLRHYAGVIEDGSLSCGVGNRTLKHIRAVVFAKGRPTVDSFLPFDLSWKIILRDGTAITVDVKAQALPNGKPLISNLIRLGS